MEELLVEIFCEEIPADLQQSGASRLKIAVGDNLNANGLSFITSTSFATPNRLSVHLTGIPERQADRIIERKGPRVIAPAKAVNGFLRACGLTSLDQVEIHSDPGKGDFYLAKEITSGMTSADYLKQALPTVLAGFYWPTAMRWGSSNVSWIRPVRSILCLLGDGRTSKIIDFKFGDVRAGNLSFGHRFLAPGGMVIKNYRDYREKLVKARVVIDVEQRKEIILDQINSLAQMQGLKLIDDRVLLDEIAGLCEWPVVKLGRFSPQLLKLPSEVVICSIRNHQKCFTLTNSHTDTLAPFFALVTNIEAKDGGTALVDGNERVIAARLADGDFFWRNDLKSSLEDKLEMLKKVIFHHRLGSQSDRAYRLEQLAFKIAKVMGADQEFAARAALLAKADLASEMVGEFPELQGVMGYYYAKHQGEPEQIATAIRDHYKPVGADDNPPSASITIAVGMADKIDMLVCFWKINEKPTGSKDPYGLRRAAFGVIRMILANNLSLSLQELLNYAGTTPEVCHDLIDFIIARFQIYLRAKGFRPDVVKAVCNLEGLYDLLSLMKRVEAVEKLINSPDGVNILSAYKRATNLIKAEEKKQGKNFFAGQLNADLYCEQAEKKLARVVDSGSGEVERAVRAHDFAKAAHILASMRVEIDDFFDQVTVNVENKQLRYNRLRLLDKFRLTMQQLADFSQMEMSG